MDRLVLTLLLLKISSLVLSIFTLGIDEEGREEKEEKKRGGWWGYIIRALFFSRRLVPDDGRVRTDPPSLSNTAVQLSNTGRIYRKKKTPVPYEGLGAQYVIPRIRNGSALSIPSRRPGLRAQRSGEHQ